MKALIIDDERLARAELISLLEEYDSIEIVGEAKNAKEGITLIKSLKPDVIFLDIQMPEMDGFEMIKKLEDIPKVVFVSAYDEYAIEAFRINALDYLMKPVDPERLKDTVEKLKNNSEDDEFTSKNLANRKDRMLSLEDRVFIKDGEKCYYPKLKDVRFFESHGNYIKVFFNENKPMILRSLNSLEDRLDPDHFFRANRKYIINLNSIIDIENWFNGGLQVTLHKGEKIEISRRQAIRFKDAMSI